MDFILFIFSNLWTYTHRYFHFNGLDSLSILLWCEHTKGTRKRTRCNDLMETHSTITFHNIFYRRKRHRKSQCLWDAILIILNRLDLRQKPVVDKKSKVSFIKSNQDRFSVRIVWINLQIELSMGYCKINFIRGTLCMISWIDWSMNLQNTSKNYRKCQIPIMCKIRIISFYNYLVL